MNFDKWNKQLTLVANIGVVAGLIFVALEVRTNTASNNIAIEQNYAANWMIINSTIAANADLAALLQKGLSGEELDQAESLQLQHLTRMYLTQSNHMLRLYDQGLISEAEVRGAFRSTRLYAQQGQFREEIEAAGLDERFRGLVLDDDGLDKWINVEN